MHLLVPFAADGSEACRQVLGDLALPNLERLLALLSVEARDDGEAASLSPPHERALAAARRWHGGDGLLPFAAHAAASDGVATVVNRLKELSYAVPGISFYLQPVQDISTDTTVSRASDNR